MADPSAPKVPGYELLGLLGEGGMGRVYRARWEADGRVVALKVIRPRSGGAVPDHYRRRFLRETAVMRGLDHPGLPGFVDAGVTLDGLPWLAGELLEGTTLEDAPGYGSWPPSRIVPRLASLLATLSYLHARGLIHRDIKPSNVFLALGRTVLLDLGLVFVEEGTRLTATGEITGTLLTMAPEQLRGEDATSRTDLYQLAATAWLTLHDAPPRPHELVMALALGSITQVPPLRPVSGSTPLDRFLTACLAIDPSHRPGSADEAAALLSARPGAATSERLGVATRADLSPIRPSLALPSPGPPHASSRRPLVGLMVTLVALGLLLLPRLIHQAPAPLPPTRTAPAHAPGPAAPSPLDEARRAWDAFLDSHPDYDPLAELLVVAPQSLPASDTDLDRALAVLRPLCEEPSGPDRLEAALLLAKVLQARRDLPAHEVLRRFLPQLARSRPRDDPRVREALVLCLGAAMTPPRELRNRTDVTAAIRRDSVTLLAPLTLELAATDPDPSWAAVFRVFHAAFLYFGGRPTEEILGVLAAVPAQALPPSERWRWHHVRARLAEREQRWDELTALLAAGAAVAPGRAVRLYFATRQQQVQVEFMFQGH